MKHIIKIRQSLEELNAEVDADSKTDAVITLQINILSLNVPEEV
jgi:hypothetical protein